MTNPPNPTLHLHGLDALRGVAAFAVLLLHGSLLCDLHYKPFSAVLSVDFFFLLSGFVVACAYDRRPALTWLGFMRVRLIRLYPMLLVGTLLGVCVAQSGAAVDGIRLSLPIILASFTLLPVGFLLGPGIQAYPLNNPVWSLFFEIFINGFYRTRFGRKTNAALSGYVIVSGVALAAAVLLAHDNFAHIGFSTPKMFLLGFLRVNFPFWLGVLMFRLLKERRLPNVNILLLGLILAADVLAPWRTNAYVLASTGILFPVVVAFASSARISSRQIGACEILGELSYPLYLVHQPIFSYVHVELSGRVNGAAQMAVGATLSILFATGVLVGFDRPVRKWLSRATAPRRSIEAAG